MKIHLQKTKSKIIRFQKIFLKSLIIVTLFVSSISKAATIDVSSIAALNTAVTNSVAGDEIVLANGIYTNSTITIAKSNITVRAATELIQHRQQWTDTVERRKTWILQLPTKKNAPLGCL